MKTVETIDRPVTESELASRLPVRCISQQPLRLSPLLFRCSGAGTWTRCSMQPFLMEAVRKQFPVKETTTYAIERGVGIHDAMFTDLPLQEVPEAYRDAVRVLRRQKQKLMKTFEGDDWVEYREHKPRSLPVQIGDRVVHVSGTLDCAYWSSDLEQLVVIDFKTGYINVPAYNNKQLIFYAYLFLKENNRHELTRDVNLSILSSHYGIDSVSYKTVDIMSYCDKLLDEMRESLNYFVSDTTCRWCETKNFCYAYHSNLSKGVTYEDR